MGTPTARDERPTRPPYLVYALCIPGASYPVVATAMALLSLLDVNTGGVSDAIGVLSAMGAYFSPPFTLAAAFLCLARSAPVGHRLLRWVAVAAAALGFALISRLLAAFT
jgi:hypothetical protein